MPRSTTPWRDASADRRRAVKREDRARDCRGAFHAQLQSDGRAIRGCLSECRRFLGRCGAPPGTAMQVELVLAEVLNNVAEHAYDPACPGWIGLSVEVGGGRADVRIHDQGAPMPAGCPPGGALPDPFSLPEGGFGWYLIRELTERLDYARQEGLNRLAFSVLLCDGE